MVSSDSHFIRENDALLAPLLAAPDERSRDDVLEQLVVRHAEPVARRVIARHRSIHGPVAGEDADDLVATVHLRLVRRLRALAAVRDEPIAHFEDYVAALAYHTVYDVLRRRFPQRMRLKNRIRYLIERDERFTSWVTPQGTVCGRLEWRNEARRGTCGIAPGELRHRDPGDAVALIFEEADGPLLLDDVVTVLAEAWGVVDLVEVAPGTVTFPDLAPRIDTLAESRDFIVRLWREIVLLPQPQRAALLLNLRDSEGGNAISAFVLLRIASIDAIADAVGLAPEALASLWSALPINDDTIGTMLGRTRQQIIGLRKAARARLTRRLAKEMS